MICLAELYLLILAAAAAAAALDLLASELTDRGLAALGCLQQLQQLKLYQAAVSVDALQLLAGQPAGRGLQSLVLYGLGKLTQLHCLGELVRKGCSGTAQAHASKQSKGQGPPQPLQVHVNIVARV
jgi:hypothetical protein